MAPRISRGSDRSKSPAAGGKRKLDFMQEDQDDDYEVVRATGRGGLDSDDDEASAKDFSSMLAGGSSMARQAGKDDGYGTDEEEAEIANMMGSKLKQDGMSAVKAHAAKGKGKEKETKGLTGGGSWQSMGLAPPLLKSLLQRGYKTPTPIQRAAIPSAIASPPRDLVGMARTGSGKTLAYMIPLLQRFGARHSSKFGPRALILCPGRELAVQILRVGKEMARGFKQSKASRHAGDDEESDEGEDALSKTQDLRWGLVVGGEGLDEQFSMIANNPDVIIATPGRLLHLIVEMNLDLRSIEYVVFDEADRLFEMGFEVQLHEILHRLPPTRQTLLFSATLPKSLVEFARAGLTNPKLIRLDAESKISTDLRMAFFSVKPADKEAALLSLLKEVIKVPVDQQGVSRLQEEDEDEDGEASKKRFKKSKEHSVRRIMASHQAIIFAATKHHVEYLTTLLQVAGYTTSHIYGSLDQTARKFQMDSFRRGYTNLLVVTDVAARGIDIPIMENVINYDFPTGSRVFVHRVGRTARAGRKGWAWSFVTTAELPYLLDLQLFLGRPLVPPTGFTGDEAEYTSGLVLGPLPRDSLDTENEHVSTTLMERAPNLKILKEVVRKGQAMYERSQGKASQESYRRSKAMVKDPAWPLQGSLTAENKVHPIYEQLAIERYRSDSNPDSADMAAARKAFLSRVTNFQPAETVFEMGTRGKSSVAAEIMKGRRKTLDQVVKRRKAQIEGDKGESALGESRVPHLADAPVPDQMDSDVDMSEADEDQLETVFEKTKPTPTDFKDDQFYMSHYQSGAAADRGYSLKDGQSFVEQARNATFDLAGDDGVVARRQGFSQLTWDRKKKKFVQGDGTGSDNKKLVKTESGARLPASFRSGRFDEWKAKKRVVIPKVGDAEGDHARGQGSTGMNKYRHNNSYEAKPLDPKSTTYEKKVYMQKKKAEKAAEVDGAPGPKTGYAGQKARSELRDVNAIRRDRKVQEQRRAKNARPSKKGGKGAGKGGASKGRARR